jgi:3-deoxy-7-phosphoheptulonate synthase
MNVIKLVPDLTEEKFVFEVSRLKEHFKGVKRIGNSRYVAVSSSVTTDLLSGFSSVAGIVNEVPSYALASKKLKNGDGQVKIGKDSIGSGCPPLIIAGPCSVEGFDSLSRTAEAIRNLGVTYLRGGAYKPRTSPYSFQGLKRDGLEILDRVSKMFDMKIVTEVMSMDKIDEVADVAHLLQVGTRNMLNYSLLDELGNQKTPVLLKRGMMSKMEEFLLSAEYILSRGNSNVILCERGIRTFETATRNTLDLSIIPNIKQHSHLPIIVDPSHGTGHRHLVAPMSFAAMVCGADGLEIEVHHDPDNALSDGHQTITPDELEDLLTKVRILSHDTCF